MFMSVPLSLAEEILCAALELLGQKGKAGVALHSLSGIELGLPCNLRLIRKLAGGQHHRSGGTVRVLEPGGVLPGFVQAPLERAPSASVCRGVMFRWLQLAWPVRASLGLFSGPLVPRKAQKELEKL